MEEYKKKHSTFFFTDIVGYSRLVNKDEKLTLRLLNEQFRLIEKIVDCYSGRIIKYIGDATFVEFESCNNACYAAIEIQKKIYDRNQFYNKNERLILRIGIHSGNVVEKDGDLYGHDVNLASRIESSCLPGRIAISDEIYNFLDPKKFRTRSPGYIKLKNIKTPHKIHVLYLDNKSFQNEDNLKLESKFIDIGVSIVTDDDKHNYDTTSIAILFFENLNNDCSYDTSLTNDFIDDFDKINHINVPSIQEVAKYKKSDLSIIDIARFLNMENVLKCVYEIIDERIRIMLLVKDINSDKVLLEKKYEGDFVYISKIRSLIIKDILDLYDIKIPTFLDRNIANNITNNIDALKNYNDAIRIINSTKSIDDLTQTQKLLELSIENDDKFIEAYSQLAITLNKLGKIEESENNIYKALELCNDLNDELKKAFVLDKLGILNKSWNKYKSAKDNFEKALEIQMKYNDKLTESKILNNMSTCYNYLGDYDKALMAIKRSIFIKEDLEKNSLLNTSYGTLSNHYANINKYMNSIKYLKISIGKSIANQDYISYINALTLLIIHNVDLGNKDEANHYMEKVDSFDDSFKTPLIKGKIYTCKAILSYFNNQIDETISYYEDAIDEFDFSENYLQKLRTIEKFIFFLIENDEKKMFSKYYKKYTRLSFKVVNYNQSLLFKCVKIYDDYINNRVDNAKINLLFSELNKTDVSLPLIQCYFILFKLDSNQKIISIIKSKINDFKEIAELDTNYIDCFNSIPMIYKICK